MSGQAVVLVLAGLGVVLVALGATAGRRVERVSRRVGRMRVAGTGGRAVVLGAAIAAAQWAVFTWVSHPVALVAAFVVPAVLAGATVARLFAVAEIVWGGRR
jgi:hypothetical protein